MEVDTAARDGGAKTSLNILAGGVVTAGRGHGESARGGVKEKATVNQRGAWPP